MSPSRNWLTSVARGLVEEAWANLRSLRVKRSRTHPSTSVDRSNWKAASDSSRSKLRDCARTCARSLCEKQLKPWPLRPEVIARKRQKPRKRLDLRGSLAEREGFEPTVHLL